MKYKLSFLIGIILLGLIPIIIAGIGQEQHGLPMQTAIGTPANNNSGVRIIPLRNITITNVTYVNGLSGYSLAIYNNSNFLVNRTLILTGANSSLINASLIAGVEYRLQINDTGGTGTAGFCYAPAFPQNGGILSGNIRWVNGSFNDATEDDTYFCQITGIWYNALGLYGANTSAYNLSTYETSIEGFNSNYTLDATPSSVSLIYNGTSYSGTVTAFANSVYNFFRGIDIPLINMGQNWYWNITFPNGTVAQTTPRFQNISRINLTVCGASPQNTPFINFTFKNETTLAQNVNGSIVSSAWNYFLGSGSIFRSLSYSNSNEIPSHGFCVTPTDRTMTVNLSLNYDNVESEQRQFSLSNYPLSSSPLNQILYLLPSSNGLFTPFQVVTSSGSPIAGAVGTITRAFGGGTITVTTATTDSSGLVSYFLNPDVTYTATFTATGYPSTTFSFVPSTTLRTVTMGSGLTGISNGTQISINTTYSILPSNSTLGNRTNQFFSFNVSSNQPINLISMNITNRSGYQVFFNSTGGTGFVTGTIFTGDNSTFIGKFTIATATETFTTQRIWIIGSTYIGDYSIYRQLSLFRQYAFSDFIRMLLAITIILGAMYGLSKTEVIDTSESKIVVALMLVWVFSIFGWLDTNLTINSTNQGVTKLASLSSQYGIAIISSVLGAYFISKKT